MMKKINFIFILPLIIVAITFSACRECDDCLELTTKNIKYIDSNGANLLFGDQAIYNPDSILIKTENGNIADAWIDSATGTISFSLEKNYSTYRIILSDTQIDILEFELAERKSMSCCGNMTYSTKTWLNGQEIENNDLVIINR